MSQYLTVIGESSAEYTEKRSRFIATLKHCESEADALKFIEEMRSKYWDARHNVFAYSVDKGRLCRFSDDGEPHGTAGKPILDVINGNGITDCCIVVTRYFGGVLLGTGGLVRAYSTSSKDAISGAKIAEMIPCTLFSVMCDYQDHQKLVYLIEGENGVIENTEFTEKVKVSFVFKDNDSESFLNKLTETFSARLEAIEEEKRISPFCIAKNM